MFLDTKVVEANNKSQEMKNIGNNIGAKYMLTCFITGIHGHTGDHISPINNRCVWW